MDGLNVDYRRREDSSSESYARRKAREVMETFAITLLIFLLLFLVSWLGAKFGQL